MLCLVQIIVTFRKDDPGIFPLCLGSVYALIGFKGHGLFLEIRHHTEPDFRIPRQFGEVFQDVLVSGLELYFCLVPGPLRNLQ